MPVQPCVSRRGPCPRPEPHGLGGSDGGRIGHRASVRCEAWSTTTTGSGSSSGPGATAFTAEPAARRRAAPGRRAPSRRARTARRRQLELHRPSRAGPRPAPVTVGARRARRRRCSSTRPRRCTAHAGRRRASAPRRRRRAPRGQRSRRHRAVARAVWRPARLGHGPVRVTSSPHAARRRAMPGCPRASTERATFLDPACVTCSVTAGTGRAQRRRRPACGQRGPRDRRRPAAREPRRRALARERGLPAAVGAPRRAPARRPGLERVHHPQIGRVELGWEKLDMSGSPGRRFS